jgi:hypothetical protein
MTTRKRTKKPIIANPVGSFYNFPNWRYIIYQNPGQLEMALYTRKPEEGSNIHKRFITKEDLTTGKVDHSAYTFSSRFQKEVVDSLEPENRELFYRILNRKLRQDNLRRVYCQSYRDNNLVWNGEDIRFITDSYLRKFLYHVTLIRPDKAIRFALDLRESKGHLHIFNAIGYQIYAGVPDWKIAWRFKLRRAQVEAIRMLFFDFSTAPVEPIARAAYFTQLVDNAIISDTDKRFYKIAAELGEVGLKAVASYQSLTPSEKLQIEDYLASSMIDNVLSIGISVSTMKDAVAYNAVVGSLANFYIKKQELAYVSAKTKHLDASTVKLLNSTADEKAGTDDFDVEAMEMITNMAKKENELPAFPSITELNSFEKTGINGE